jgi:signal transduction histidine kinase
MEVGRELKSGGRRFILGVEGLTALVTGASALAAVVAFLVLWLLVSDAKTTLESASYSRAEYISRALGLRPTQSSLESIVNSSVPGGGVRAVLVTAENGDVIAFPSLTPEEIETADFITYSSDSGYDVSLFMELPAVLGQSTLILVLLATFAVVLTVVAIMVPSYLRRSVLEPLKSILGEADRIESGSGSTAIAANVSFQKLVQLLSRKDSQLEDMRMAALKRAHIAESRSGAVLDAMGSAVIVVDAAGNPSFWNRQASELFQLLEGSDENETGNSLKNYLQPHLSSGATEWDGEHRGRIFRFKATPGESDERIILVTDVTAPVMLERKLAEESALADLGALSGGVAHEIGNTLCALEGFLDLLGRGNDSLRSRDILNEAGIELVSARNMVESFRNLAGQNYIESTISTAEAVIAIKSICEARSVRFVQNMETCNHIPGGQILFRRILENLLSNALRVSLQSEIEVTVTDSINEHALIFSVSDRGPGLPDPPDIVFRPMYTTAESQGGMGLGLTITRRLVRAMGGSIKAENREQGGAVFSVIIPHLER